MIQSVVFADSRKNNMRIGIDLDNTIIDYDDAFVAAAKERSLIPSGFTGTKQQVRDTIRTLADGETEWQKLQGYVYGKGIRLARVFPGVKEFIAHALSGGHELFIVSHKTEFGHYDETRTNLRAAAMGLLEANGFFSALKFDAANISFHSTRHEKIDQIKLLMLDLFIDDLVEVYEEKHFPVNVRKILFHPAEKSCAHWQVCRDWQEISALLLA